MLNPRLEEYLNAVDFHKFYGIKPKISLDKQFQITKIDKKNIKKYLDKCSNVYTMPDSKFKVIRDNHPLSYNNNNITKKTPYDDSMMNDIMKHKENKEIQKRIQCYDNLEYSNVNVENDMLFSEPSRISGKKTSGVNINRFDDIFSTVQEKFIHPFEFPRGGTNSRDPKLYDHLQHRVI